MTERRRAAEPVSDPDCPSGPGFISLPPMKGRNAAMSVIRSASLVAAAAAIAVMSVPAASQDQFYAGKSIDLVIGYPPAGSNDVYSRALARHLGKHIPGKPNIVPKNMPGAGSFKALSYMTSVAAKD